MAKLVCLVVWLFLLSASAAESERLAARKVGIPRPDFVLLERAHREAEHELVFAVQQKNLVELDEILMERSSPDSLLFQQWLSFDEVGQLTSNKEGADAVLNWLTENNIPVKSITTHMDYITAKSTIAVWESLLGTEFYRWDDTSKKSAIPNQHKRSFHRAKELVIPAPLAPHISTIFNTVQVPPVLHPRFHRAENKRSPKNGPTTEASEPSGPTHLRTAAPLTTRDGTVTVAFLNDYYEITSNAGNATQQQAVFETAQEYFSPDDLTLFQQSFNLPVEAALHPFGYNTSDCTNNDCYEGNLDVQYIMGIAQHTSTVYWYVDSDTDPFVVWITQVADMTNPPLVHSISWGAVEQGQDYNTLHAFNTEALKLSVRGVTIAVSSGDNGVASYAQYCNSYSGSDLGYWDGDSWSGKGYFPSFPATSPYVTAVGATMGPENGDPEIACQSQLGGVITTGGGFSTFSRTPNWQKDAVNAYFDALTSSNTPTAGYNRHGRGYPDVSLIGVAYQVVLQGSTAYLYGTSASAPVFAAMISIINAARARSNLTSVGFVNPALYHSSRKKFRDITEGHNRCIVYADTSHPQGATCCNSGFHATKGWDPLTGLGSITLNALKDVSGTATDDDGATDDDSSDTSKTLSIGGIVGIVIGGVSFLVMVVSGTVWIVMGCRACCKSSVAASA